ncbi:MarR family transcriptional regulator [Streptomyces sp. NPDC102360]|uniref:MarR family transcriptional regulator n=1 Tax=Streptomyces sp. NPDC102360 TaxID=3366160 RepID=UPI003803D3E5
MSDTTGSTTIRALRPVPAPEPLGNLSGTPATAYTHLSAHPDGITVAELALAAGLGRSTTGKALTTLESHGLAVRTPGGHDGPRRTPDRWHPAPAPAQDSGPASPPKATTAPTHLSPQNATEPADPAPQSPNTQDDAAHETLTLQPKTQTQTQTQAEAEAEAETQSCITGAEESRIEADPEEAMTPPNATPGAPATPEEPTEPTPLSAAAPQQPKPVPVGSTVRLAPGSLRQLVLAHLTAHPEEAFTATGVSRVLEKSSGAIANCLVKLAGLGIAEQVTERPRTYRIVPGGAERPQE